MNDNLDHMLEQCAIIELFIESIMDSPEGAVMQGLEGDPSRVLETEEGTMLMVSLEDLKKQMQLIAFLPEADTDGSHDRSARPLKVSLIYSIACHLCKVSLVNTEQLPYEETTEEDDDENRILH